MSRIFSKNAHHLSGLLLFLAALTLYGLTLCPDAFPGESARSIVRHTGLDPFPPMTNPIWTLFVRLIEVIPGGSLAFRLNLFSAVCGALSVWAVFWVSVLTIPWLKPTGRGSGEWDAVSMLTGWTAGLFLMFCIPFWVMSTRAFPLSLDILLLLLTTLFFILAWNEQQIEWLIPFVLFYGIGMTEFSTFILCAPLFGTATLILLWLCRRFNLPTLLGLTACLIPGGLVYLIMAWKFMQTPAFEWFDVGSYFQGLWYVLVQHKMKLFDAVP
ncbi:MAG: DUF2723 domain-containing protein, partial [Verrucomicrobiota bacterium]